MSETPAQYDYEFSVWPAEGKHGAAVYELFRHYPRACVTVAEAGFSVFREQLGMAGLTLREVTRVPHHDPEVVP